MALLKGVRDKSRKLKNPACFGGCKAQSCKKAGRKPFHFLSAFCYKLFAGRFVCMLAGGRLCIAPLLQWGAFLRGIQPKRLYGCIF